MSKLQISLAAARVNARMTQDEVAKALNVSKKTIGNWENGIVVPNFSTLFTLADLYGISTNDIVLPKKST